MSLGVRKEALSRWEIQLIRLRAESLQHPCCVSNVRFRGSCPSHGDSDVDRSVMASSRWKAIRLWAGSEHACLFFAGRLRIVSEVTVSGNVKER